ncbi:hypothetical protein ACFX11_015124 [Malus domestica]
MGSGNHAQKSTTLSPLEKGEYNPYSREYALRGIAVPSVLAHAPPTRGIVLLHQPRWNLAIPTRRVAARAVAT